ncbi:amidohydrolase family protein [Planomonospora sp. ID67723]|uniref:amidohydrolase family protein n=1 Tax=Planomonospora sp. ID67723 TaxID=2738134 RepID=UPI0018C3D9DC|nr:amidohydrolase family protein [Planomonospora sp. ID67723]MBG0829045.1 amidohydrolase family protein [Planomonospora sp. ID67723]
MPELLPAVAALRLVDHHCHGVVPEDLSRAGFEALLTEAEGASPLGGSLFDTQAGLAVRRWCAPVLDLPRHAEPEEYLARRAELGHTEVTRRLLRAAGLGGLCVDTGYTPRPLLSPAELAGAAGAPGYEILRLERVAEEVAGSGTSAADFAGRVHERLAASVRAGGVRVVGAKSVAAYRAGLALAPERPGPREVVAAAGRWLAALRPDAPVRLADEVLHRFLVYAALDLGLPVQFHVGYGDSDVHLARANPVLLTDLLRATAPAGVPIVLLHNYPYHREAGYLAQVFPHVFADVSLAMHNLGRRAGALLAEALELTPFGKLLYASDACGLPELYHLGAVLFRRALSELLRDGLDEDSWTERDAVRIAAMVGAGNASRVYRLPG